MAEKNMQETWDRMDELEGKINELSKKVGDWSWGEDGEEADAAWFAGLKIYLKTHSGASITTDSGNSILGTTKKVTLTEEILGTIEHEIMVIGIDQDADNTITWQTKDMFNKYLPEFGSSAVWIGSTARAYCQSYYNAFPGRMSIKTVRKGTCPDQVSSKNGTAVYNNETVWLPSESEMGLNSYSSLTLSNATESNAECTEGKNFSYAYYTSNASRIKNFNGDTDWYWLRSRYYGNSSIVCGVYSDGCADWGHYSVSSYGFAPAFTIGN